MTAKCLTLFVTLMVLTSTGNTMAQSLKDQGTWQFGAGGNTIAGPGVTTICDAEQPSGNFTSVWTTASQSEALDVCATVKNLGTRDILIDLSEISVSGITKTVQPGTTRAICRFATKDFRILAAAGDDRARRPCLAVWRVDQFYSSRAPK